MAAHPADGKLKLHLANVQTSQSPIDGSLIRITVNPPASPWAKAGNELGVL